MDYRPGVGLFFYKSHQKNELALPSFGDHDKFVSPGVFHLMMLIIMLNLLIAMMSTSFNDIQVILDS